MDYPPEGGRETKKNRRRSGTRVTALMPWGKEEAESLLERMPMIRPPEGTEYTVNRKRVERREAEAVHTAVLQSVITAAPGQPLRPTRRRTDIHIMRAREGTGWLFEMGIPIQEIELPYDVDVQQKVAMPPNRDTVSEKYLQDIYAEVLNAMHELMREDDFRETWVRNAMESQRPEPEAVRDTILGRYGEKAVTWSTDTEANMQAAEEGYQVIHPRNMSREELKTMREKGGLQSAGEVFGRPKTPEEILERSPRVDITGDAVKEDFARWVVDLGEHAGKEVKTVFIRDQRLRALATCTMNSERPEMTFNLAFLDDGLFEGRDERQLDLVIHELGHAETDGAMSHGPRWGEGCARVGAMIALGMAGGRSPAERDKEPGPGAAAETVDRPDPVIDAAPLSESAPGRESVLKVETVLRTVNTAPGGEIDPVP